MWMIEFWIMMIVNIVYIFEKVIVFFYFVLIENKMIFLIIYDFGLGCLFFMKMRIFVWFRKKGDVVFFLKWYWMFYILYLLVIRR